MIDFSYRRMPFGDYVSATIKDLDECYQYQNPQASAVDFIINIVNVVLHNDDPSVEDHLKILMQFASDSDRKKGEDYLANSPYGAIIIACTYCMRARLAAKDDDMELAWSYMADAKYWSGVAVASRGLDKVERETILKTREQTLLDASTLRGKAGARGRDMSYEPLRQYAYSLVREKQPTSGWKSRSHAVKVIRDAVLAFSDARTGLTLSRENFSKTLDSWLAQMPDAKEVFGSKTIVDTDV